MTYSTPLPNIWLLSDARNDGSLEQALAALPRGSAFVFRHYHPKPEQRRERFAQLAALARAAGHLVILSGDAEQGAAWNADGVYGPPKKLGPKGGLLRLATAHDEREIDLANQIRADAVFLSPVFPTRSHDGDACLGGVKFKELAARSQIPVIALGGMNAERARELGWPRWAAIDGLSSQLP